MSPMWSWLFVGVMLVYLPAAALIGTWFEDQEFRAEVRAMPWLKRVKEALLWLGGGSAAFAAFGAAMLGIAWTWSQIVALIPRNPLDTVFNVVAGCPRQIYSHLVEIDYCAREVQYGLPLSFLLIIGVLLVVLWLAERFGWVKTVEAVSEPSA